jgi:serine/threonine-protein kinase
VQALEALAEAHAAGIVHRDVKPANLFLVRDASERGSIKLLDFGISKLTSSDSFHTASGAILGTPQYMSPEQMLSSRDVDARTDIWALGVILFELITGQRPFKSDTPAGLCVAVLQDEPRAPSEVNPELPSAVDAVVRGCLAKAPENRFADVADLALSLLPFADARARLTIEGIWRTHRGSAVPATTAAAGAPAPLSPVPTEATRLTGLHVSRVVWPSAILACALAATVAYFEVRSRAPVPAPTASAATATASTSVAAPPLRAPPGAPTLGIANSVARLMDPVALGRVTLGLVVTLAASRAYLGHRGRAPDRALGREIFQP